MSSAEIFFCVHFTIKPDVSAQVDAICNKIRGRIWMLRHLHHNGFSETELLTVYKLCILYTALMHSTPASLSHNQSFWSGFKPKLSSPSMAMIPCTTGNLWRKLIYPLLEPGDILGSSLSHIRDIYCTSPRFTHWFRSRCPQGILGHQNSTPKSLPGVAGALTSLSLAFAYKEIRHGNRPGEAREGGAA